MIGATSRLYISSNSIYDPTLANAVDTGIDLNFSLCESKYTYNQINDEITGKYLFDKDAKLNSTTATLLDKYSPGWNNVFGFGSFASDYVGSAVNAAPDHIGKFFPSFYSQNIYDLLSQHIGGRLYLPFKNNNVTYGILTAKIISTGRLHDNLYLNNDTWGLYLWFDMYGIDAPPNKAWGNEDTYRWRCSGGWTVKCKDGRYCSINLSGFGDDDYRIRLSVSRNNSSEWASFLNLFNQGWKPLIPDNDPYIKGDKTGGGSGTGSGTGGGTGDFNGTTEDVNIPDLPTLSAVDTGLISLFNPSSAQLKTVANYLWGSAFDLSTWKKMFADPMDAILGLSIVPVSVPSSGSASLTIGNISTGITLPKVSSQYVTVDCGTINVNEYWGAYLDYSPYTQAEIYLPFIGIHPMTIDDIMGKSVHVVYHIDVLSGACCAYVKCGGSVLYSFVGQCSCSIPITSNDWTNVINGTISIAASIGTMVATGGASAPMAIPGMAATATNSLKPTVEKSGAMGGMGGMLGVQNPYIILTRPKQAIPAYQNTFTGYPSFITKTLSECSGYTEVESIHLENVPATDGELQEINDLLKSGVII